MFDNWFSLFSMILSTNIGICVTAKGSIVKKKDKKRKSKIIGFLFGEHIRITKLHLTVLLSNIVFVFIDVYSRFMNYRKLEENEDFFIVLKNFCLCASENLTTLIIVLLSILILTVFFMALTYRSTNLESPNDDKGNQILSVEEIDKKYIEFSLPNNIDSHSELLLIAGDLSFFGELPNITNASSRKKSRCVHHLSNNKQDHSFCNGKKCPSQISNCIESSSQFEQLFKLVEKGVTIRVICKHPANSTDIQYKRRLGRLKSIYKDSMEIKFFPEETLSDDFCVLGRIKKNGGIKELFWHWKAPGRAGYYTVPETLRATTSDNITIIYLFEEVLWNYAKEDTKVIDESIELYNEYIDEIK